ncbi:E3 ubiquitin-protein ligase rnf168 [Labrus bergylta]|uniref:E3 ubiquitin-protein ligase rnf168 n=1 Tax=Labrus bergylta TaxID=56723 RepID=UPI0033137450
MRSCGPPIQDAFPVSVRDASEDRRAGRTQRGRGQENPEDDLGVCCPRVCEPGELRQEYEEQVNKLTEERRALEEEEKRASEELIQRLLAEEEVELQEETKRRDEDERLARHLSTQLNSAVSQGDARPADAPLPKKKKKEVVSGQIEKFLSPRPSSSSSSSDCSFTSNKENILFPQLDSLRDTSGPPEEEQLRPEGGPSCAKRKSQEMLEEEEEEVMATKQICVPSSSGLQGVAEWEAELLSRRQQEEEDRRLALLLQKELDQEERLKATDRRKGSSDAYPLRQDRRSKEEADRRTGHASSTRRTGHASSSSSSRTRSKQKTLTEMFSSLNNGHVSP